MKSGSRLARSQDIGDKVAKMLGKRLEVANGKFTERIGAAYAKAGADSPKAVTRAVDPMAWANYVVDAAQRSVLFLDTLRQRGDDFLENTAAGLKPVLHFDHETVLDAREFGQPVNYALLRILPPEGVAIDARKRPYIIIDPRAGHGPGIGGFKDDSQVGVALRAGHPVYFIMFFRDPEPGQTLVDVCAAEQKFVRKVRELHPKSEKPALVGNCQGGWAAMMLAASDPRDAGPIVINGAPMSYWGGAISEGEGDNPMRYAGGMLGGTWLASLMADLGNGKFDGAHLVQNFENLNPANSLWDKYYNLFNKADTEPPRFLEFERWWGGYYLMNAAEIEWITQNLFVGNKLWDQGVKDASGQVYDLKQIRQPVILFASMGDNITPPQQAFNWVVDVYGSTAEIKKLGQVIVGLVHEDIGHLGIFVSGRVAKKEHAQIVNVLETIERLPPGLYGMEIADAPGKGKGDGAQYQVTFKEYALEDIAQRLNRLGRQDEKPFEAVAQVSEFMQRGYELFARPFVQAVANEQSAALMRAFHPLRVQNWALSHFNPWMAALQPLAEQVRASRKALPQDHAMRKAEHMNAEIYSAMLDHYRGVRDAFTEAGFFTTYGNLVEPGKPALYGDGGELPATAADARGLPIVRDALANMEHGGYVEALARVAFLLMRQGEPLPLSRLELNDDLVADYEDDLPGMSPHDWRRIRGEQEIIARYEPEQALATLPLLLDEGSDRERLVGLLDKLLAYKRVQATAPSAPQVAMLGRIRKVLGVAASKPARRRAAPRRKAATRRA
jgi:pimeloyl-ACP methyl ester carboxylesterase